MTNLRSTSEVAIAALGFAEALATRLFTNTDHLRGKAVYLTGSGPYLISDLGILLPDGIYSADIGENPPDDYNEPSPAYVVVGRAGFDEAVLLDCITHSQTTPAFLPQEGFLDLVLFGYDWWNECLDELNKSLEYHEGLQYIRSLEHVGFEWPTVAALASEELGDSQQTFRTETPLHQAGYMIRGPGNRKIARSQRWSTLCTIVETQRLSLHEVAGTISNHVRLRKLREDGPETYRYAIQEWEHDLARLKRDYYDGKNYTLQWPVTDS